MKALKNAIGLLLVLSMGITVITCCDNDPDPVLETCSDGIQNQDETAIDCGGEKCIECFDCFSNFCSFLSGGTFLEKQTSITWKATLIDGEPFVIDPANLVTVFYGTARFKFSNKGALDFTFTEGDDKGRWNFDDPDDPTKIQLKIIDGNHPSEDLTLVSLKENEFVIDWWGVLGTFEPVN